MTDTAQQTATASAVAVVQAYLGDLGRGDLAAASARFSDDLVYVAPGRNQLAGITRGRDAAGRWSAAMGELSGGTYRMTAPVDWLASDTHALLLAREHASLSGRDHDWQRAVLFTVDDGQMRRVQLFEDDQYAYDAWLGGQADGPATEQPDEAAPAGAPHMSGDLDDPRVRAVLSYQRQVAAGDLEHAARIFWPDVVYTVPGHSQLSGDYQGPEEVMGYLGKLFALTDDRYAISRMHWLTSADRVGLLTRNHATVGASSLSWDELIVFTFVEGRKKAIAHFSADQYGVDALFS